MSPDTLVVTIERVNAAVAALSSLYTSGTLQTLATALLGLWFVVQNVARYIATPKHEDIKSDIGKFLNKLFLYSKVKE